MTTTGTTTLNLARDEFHRGWVCYDAGCPLCRHAAGRFEAPLARRHFQLVPLQTGWVQARLGLKPAVPLDEMKLIAADGTIFDGADAVVQITRQIWWLWPLFAFAQIPGAMIFFRVIYRRIAANRNCVGGACRLPKHNHALDFLPLGCLPMSVLLVRGIVPAWVFMWLLAFAIFWGCKWLTWRRAVRQVGVTRRFLSLGYLFGWVGMDAKKFLRADISGCSNHLYEWLWTAGKIFVGTALIWLVAPRFLNTQPLLAGWLAMLGIILCLHFGLFQLLALAWRFIGVDASPIMRHPLCADSLADFWGRRWNGAFHQLANDFLFRPLLRKFGPTAATAFVFLVSGLIHDALISLPARGGYGLPTAYFLLQGCGVLFERTTFGKSLGLGAGWRGWLFAFICTAAPAFWLFHPDFVLNVILPMLRGIGAT
jgi:predicted DCC family thiol-disulfide oxidoreductase YuxK